jgi:hypothetical protein
MTQPIGNYSPYVLLEQGSDIPYILDANSNRRSLGTLINQGNRFDSISKTSAKRLIDMSAAVILLLVDGASVVWVETVKDFFRWDATSTETTTPTTIINPTINLGNPGRFIRMGVPAPEWMLQQNWYNDNLNVLANDENDASAATPLLTDAERQRRMGTFPLWTKLEYHLYYLNDMPTSDPVIISGQCPVNIGGVDIFIHANATKGSGKAVLATLTADVVTAENRPAGTNLAVQANAIPVSWTASGWINSRCRMTSGANIGGFFWPAFDSGAKTAQVSPPQAVANFTVPFVLPTTNTFAPVNGETFVVESLTVIAVLMVNLVGFGTGTSNSVVLDSVQITQCMVQAGGLDAIGCDWASSAIRQQFSNTTNFYGVRLRANGRYLASTTFTVVNCYASDEAAGAPFLGLVGYSGTILRFTTWQRQGIIVAANNECETAFASASKPWLIQSPFGIFNNSAGPGMTLTNCSFNASTFELWGVCGAGGTPIFLTSGCCLYYRATPPGQANMYLINVAAAPTACWISYQRAQAVVVSAPTFNYGVAPPVFTTVRNLTPALLQDTNLATGFNGQWFDPLSGCGMRAK